MITLASGSSARLRYPKALSAKRKNQQKREKATEHDLAGATEPPSRKCCAAHRAGGQRRGDQGILSLKLAGLSLFAIMVLYRILGEILI